MLQINNLTITLEKNLKNLVEDFSFSLNEGDRAVIIGEEGNGKSTLLKLIYDENLVSNYASYTGNIYKGNLRLGYLPQEFPPQSETLSVYEYLESFGVYESAEPSDIAAAALQLRLDNGFLYSSRICKTLSGGEKIKLQLARIYSLDPDILLLDEPSNDIDLDTVEWLENFIINCKKPVLFISHDETLIEKTANVIIHLEMVRKKTLARYTIARMDYETYIENRANSLRHQEQRARSDKSEYDKQMERWRQIYEKVEHRQAAVSRQDPHSGQLLKKKMKSVKSQGRRFEREKDEMTQLPDIEDAIFAVFRDVPELPNSKDVLRFELSELKADGNLLSKDIKLVVTGPEHIGIIGANGTGKTTLLKMIAAELMKRTDIKASYMPQNYEDLLDLNVSPVEFLSKNVSKDEITKARTFLGSMKYTQDEMLGKISELSGGQKAKLLFLDMVLKESNVLILDEPTRNFSPLSNPVIRAALREFPGAIISITHDRKYLSEVCDKVYRLSGKGFIQVNRDAKLSENA